MLNSYPKNAEKGLPTFTGMLMVFDSETGMPLGVMDASYITCMRTGAAVAVLLPFRMDFYRKLGYGCGTRLDEYHIRTEYLPECRDISALRFCLCVIKKQ